jgi:hypothetical protein
LTLGVAPYADPRFPGRFRHNALFIGANVRDAVRAGQADYTPIFLSEIPGLFRSGRIQVDVALVQVSPPDRAGYVSLGISVDVVKSAIEAANVVLAEVNPAMPRTHGDSFVHVRDMFELDEEEREKRTVRDLMRPIMLVPETKPASDLMRQMQQENSHMVIVVDEYGNTAGIATMEDLLEVIIGEIRDEHEPESDVTEDGQGGFIVSGSFDLDRISELVDTFHREEDIESTTVGGLASEWLGRVPKVGESVDRDGIRLDVLVSDGLRVGQVRISRSQTVAQ